MSNLYKKYLSLKIENSENFYLFESGIFYIFLAEDAKVMSPVLNLKLTNLNSIIVKCGFPTSQLSKRSIKARIETSSIIQYNLDKT